MAEAPFSSLFVAQWCLGLLSKSGVPSVPFMFCCIDYVQSMCNLCNVKFAFFFSSQDKIELYLIWKLMMERQGLICIER
jgi:hypothetical protein